MSQDPNSTSNAAKLMARLKPAVTTSWEAGDFTRRPKEMLARITLDSYYYAPLPTSTSIRLLRLEPGAGSDVIRCSLRVVDLETKPAFIALSYSWKNERGAFQSVKQFVVTMHEVATWIEMASARLDLSIEKPPTKFQFHMQVSEMANDYTSIPDEQEPESERLIICDGRSMKIQQNLYEALLALRSKMFGDYWVDAVCINQSDTDERTTQVQMMGNIYREAARVVVWLGSLTPFLQPGLDAYLQGLREDIAKRRDTESATIQTPTSGTADIGTTKGEPGRKNRRDFGKFIDDTATMTTIGLFLSRRWWRRLWTVQEYCLAREAVFLFNTQEIALDLVNQAFDIENGFKHIEGGWKFPQWTRIRRSVTEMLQLRENFRDGKRWTLPEWLQIVKGRKARDVEDALFAGMALIQPDQLAIDQSLQVSKSEPFPLIGANAISNTIAEGTLWKCLHVDCRSSAFNVLLNIAACLITHFGWEELFYHTLLFRKVYGQSPGSFPLYTQPSWIPDPSSWSSSTMEPFIMRKNSGVPFSLPNWAIVKDVAPRISRDGATLTLSAAKLDTIAQCSYFVFSADLIVCNNMTLRFFEFVANKIPNIYGPNGISGLVALSTSFNNVSRMMAPPVPHHVEDYAALENFCRFMHHIYKTVQSSEPLLVGERVVNMQKKEIKVAWTKIKKSYPDAPWPNETSSGNVKEKLVDKMMDHLFHKDPPAVEEAPLVPTWSIFVTHSGYLGFGPSCLQENDQIFLIVEGKTPYVFRDIEQVVCTREVGIAKELSEASARMRKHVAARMDNETFGKAHEQVEKDKIDRLEAEMTNLRERRGKGVGWQLLGEVYVEGVMNGEVADTMSQKLERCSLV